MFNIAVFKQDFMINKKTILVGYLFQLASLLLATIIRNMRLIQISDIFWDTLPIVVIPMIVQMVLAFRLVRQCEMEKTMVFLLCAENEPVRIIAAKAVFLCVNTFLMFAFSMFYGCLTHVYDLTGVWNGNTYIVLHMGAMCLQTLIGGWCFFASCLGKKPNAVLYLRMAVCVPVLLYGLYLLYYIYPNQLYYLQYVTIFSLFRQEMFASASLLVLPSSLILAAAGIGFFLLGGRIFCRRYGSK